MLFSHLTCPYPHEFILQPLDNNPSQPKLLLLPSLSLSDSQSLTNLLIPSSSFRLKTLVITWSTFWLMFYYYYYHDYYFGSDYQRRSPSQAKRKPAPPRLQLNTKQPNLDYEERSKLKNHQNPSSHPPSIPHHFDNRKSLKLRTPSQSFKILYYDDPPLPPPNLPLPPLPSKPGKESQAWMYTKHAEHLSPTPSFNHTHRTGLISLG